MSSLHPPCRSTEALWAPSGSASAPTPCLGCSSMSPCRLTLLPMAGQTCTLGDGLTRCTSKFALTAIQHVTPVLMQATCSWACGRLSALGAAWHQMLTVAVCCRHAQWSRLPRIVRYFDVIAPTTTIASALGGELWLGPSNRRAVHRFWRVVCQISVPVIFTSCAGLIYINIPGKNNFGPLNVTVSGKLPLKPVCSDVI